MIRLTLHVAIGTVDETRVVGLHEQQPSLTGETVGLVGPGAVCARRGARLTQAQVLVRVRQHGALLHTWPGWGITATNIKKKNIYEDIDRCISFHYHWV